MDATSAVNSLEHTKRKRTRKKEEKAVSACTQCRLTHASCDNGIPCTRCINKGIGHLCETVFKKKGRPSKIIQQVNSTSTQMPLDSLVNIEPVFSSVDATSLSSILSLPDSFFDDISLPVTPSNSTPLNSSSSSSSSPSLSSSSSAISSTSQTLSLTPLTPLQTMDCLTCSYFPTLSHETLKTDSLSCTGASDIDKNNANEINPIALHKGFVLENNEVVETKQDIGVLQKIERTAVQVSVSDPAIATLLRKVTKYITTIFKDCNEGQIVDYYNRKVVQLRQVYSEFGIPVILCSAFCLVYANSPALIMLGMTKDDLLMKKSIYPLFWPEDGVVITKKWCEGLFAHSNIDKLRIRVQNGTGNLVECCANITFHRESFTGIPLLESFFFMPL